MRRLKLQDFKRREERTAARAELLLLAEQQSSNLATNFSDLLGNGGPTDETADEMIDAIREWRSGDTNPSG